MIESGPRGIRVHKAMARAGVASRRAAERLMAQGQVEINGSVVREPGACLLPGDRLAVSGAPVAWDAPAAAEVWALYKPKRCVSTLRDPQGRKTVQDYLPRSAGRLFPIGRLDYDDEGLLLLTNDGELARRVERPSFKAPRVYLVKIKGSVTPDTAEDLARSLGPPLRGRGVRVRTLHRVGEKSWLEIKLPQGTRRPLKRLLAAAGHPVLKLKRYQIGPVELGDLNPGQSRRLAKSDIARLLASGGTEEDTPRRRPTPAPLARGEDTDEPL